VPFAETCCQVHFYFLLPRDPPFISFKCLFLFTENLDSWLQGLAVLQLSFNLQIISSLTKTSESYLRKATGTSSDFHCIKTNKIVEDKRNMKTLLFERKTRRVFRRNTREESSSFIQWTLFQLALPFHPQYPAHFSSTSTVSDNSTEFHGQRKYLLYYLDNNTKRS